MRDGQGQTTRLIKVKLRACEAHGGTGGGLPGTSIFGTPQLTRVPSREQALIDAQRQESTSTGVLGLVRSKSTLGHLWTKA